MSRTHTHRPGGPVCPFPTKKECDASYRALLARRKAEGEAIARQRVEQEKARRVETYRAYERSEAERVRRGGPPV